MSLAAVQADRAPDQPGQKCQAAWDWEVALKGRYHPCLRAQHPWKRQTDKRQVTQENAHHHQNPDANNVDKQLWFRPIGSRMKTARPLWARWVETGPHPCISGHAKWENTFRKYFDNRCFSIPHKFHSWKSSQGDNLKYTRSFIHKDAPSLLTVSGGGMITQRSFHPRPSADDTRIQPRAWLSL